MAMYKIQSGGNKRGAKFTSQTTNEIISHIHIKQLEIIVFLLKGKMWRKIEL